MRALFRRMADRVVEWYRGMSIQMVLSLSFTTVAVVGVIFMGAACCCAFPTPPGA